MPRLRIQISLFFNAHKRDNETKNKKKKKKKKEKKRKKNKSVEVFTIVYSRLVTNPFPNTEHHGLTRVAHISSNSYFIYDS